MVVRPYTPWPPGVWIAWECKLSCVRSPMESGCIQITRSMTKNVEYGFQLVIICHSHVTLCPPNSTGLSWCICLCVCILLSVYCCSLFFLPLFFHPCWASCLCWNREKQHVVVSPLLKVIRCSIWADIQCSEERMREREREERVGVYAGHGL